MRPTEGMFRAKLAHALQLRDAALTVVRRIGIWEGVGDMRFLCARAGSLNILYRTPFQRMPQDDKLKYQAMEFGVVMPKSLPYGLDISAPKKVLSME